MARRATWRIPIRLNVKLNSEGKTCSGIVTNLSEKGMFISTSEIDFRKDSKFDISIPVEDRMLRVPGKIIRVAEAEIHGGCEGIGVELQDPPKKYLDFVENLLFVL